MGNSYGGAQSEAGEQEAEQLALKAQRDLARIRIEAKRRVAQAEAIALRAQKQEITPDLVKRREIDAQLQAPAQGDRGGEWGAVADNGRWRGAAPEPERRPVAPIRPSLKRPQACLTVPAPCRTPTNPSQR